MVGVTFGTKHSYNDFGLILSSKDIGLPEPKTETQDVPGADGELDFTEVLTDDVKYKNRKISFTFTVKNPIGEWSTILSTITNYLHGRTMQVILDVDKNFYYEGRCSVNQFKSNKRTSTIVVDCNLKPYKVEVNSTSEPWKWDTFNFYSGVIYVNEVTVSGTKTVNLINRRKIVSPTFKCSAAMAVTFSGITYNLTAGTNKVLGIRLQEGNNSVTFRGTGTVAIEYKGGSL